MALNDREPQPVGVLPTLPVLPPASVDDDPPPVRELLARMQGSRGFPALSAAVLRIQHLTSSESENLHTLAAEILKDVALTQKLLRLVNTAHFSHAGAGGIGTVSRAVALIGFRGVRDLALSLVLLEHLPDKAQARLREEYLRVLLAAALAGELAGAAHAGELAFVGTLFQGLGRLLVEYYCPAEAERVRALVAPVRGSSVLQRDAAAWQVLGATLSQIGRAVARVWGLPDELLRCMSVPEPEQPPRRAAAPGDERQRWLGRASQELAELMLATPAERLPAVVLPFAQRYAPVLDIGTRDIVSAAERMRIALPQWARALGLESALRSEPSGAPLSPRRAAAPVTPVEPTAQAILTDGVQDLTEMLLAEPPDPDAVLRLWIEVVWRGLRARHVVLCLRDDSRPELVGRHALGLESAAALSAFRVPLADPAADPFAWLCLQGADTLIADARGGEFAARLPRWYREHIDAGTLLLMPLLHKGRPLGLLYADRAAPMSFDVGEKEWPLLRTLRNQVLLALRQR